MDTEYLGEGLRVAGIGFAVVMIALTLLWIIMVAFSHFLRPEEAHSKRKTAPPPGGLGDAVRTSPEHANAEKRSEHLRRIAAITAAVAATMAGTGGADFRIVSVRPIRNPDGNAWRFAGRGAALPARPRPRR
ncbi:MAG: OadG family protein [Spirochaetales bacterium]